jgi:hypothetical protein
MGMRALLFLKYQYSFFFGHISSQYILAYQTHSFSALGTAFTISENNFYSTAKLLEKSTVEGS